MRICTRNNIMDPIEQSRPGNSAHAACVSGIKTRTILAAVLTQSPATHNQTSKREISSRKDFII